jgi:lysosomal Pro-X carboxypeptidase
MLLVKDVNHTGLMWENAATYNALLVFAEHRYYGASKPFADGTPDCLQWLTTEQVFWEIIKKKLFSPRLVSFFIHLLQFLLKAMADYAILIGVVKQQYNAASAPVVGFGGSYGGMVQRNQTKKKEKKKSKSQKMKEKAKAKGKV